MGRGKPGRESRVGAAAACVLAASALAAPARAADDGGVGRLWNGVLEMLNVKAAPPGPAPDFVERTRPDPDSLGYLKTALPHKVSPLPVKTPAEIEAKKSALDAAQVRQLQPAPAPVELGKRKKPAKTGSTTAGD